MKKYDFSLTLKTPGNNANHTAKITYFGETGKQRIDQQFEEFSGETQEEVIAKATKAVQNWISKQEK